jgi:hypothetical protein
MSYIAGLDFISDTTECRRLARRIVNADFTDDQIESWQYKYYSYIRTLTDKDDWDEDDREFGSLQIIETELVAAEIIKHYGGPDYIQVWMDMKESAQSDLKDIVSNMDTEAETSETDVDIGRTSFKGWGLNANTDVPNRMTWNSSSDVENL